MPTLLFAALMMILSAFTIGAAPGIVTARTAGQPKIAAGATSTRPHQRVRRALCTTDAASFGAATLALLSVSAMASYFPARRAAQLDPLVALRQE